MNELRSIIDSTLIPHTAFQEATRRLEQCFSYSDGSSEPICIAVLGESRTGKSRALEECWIRHQKVRYSEGMSVPILRVKTPSKPTVKGLVELMLRAMDDPRYTSGTEQSKTVRLQTLMKNSGTRFVMIDEFQHFYDKGSHKVMHYVADWLKNLVDDTKVALGVAGLPMCRAVLDQNEQLAGRFLSPIVMPRFDWKIDEHREEFVAILDAFYESLSVHFKLPEIGNKDLAFRCYCATGGLIGYLAKFLRQAVWNALDGNTRKVTFEDLARAHEQAVWSQEGLTDIRSPFDRRFSAVPTESLLARIHTIGVPLEEQPRSRIRQRHNVALSVSQVLTGG